MTNILNSHGKQIRAVLDFLIKEGEIKKDKEASTAIGKSPSYLSQNLNEYEIRPSAEANLNALLKHYSLEIKEGIVYKKAHENRETQYQVSFTQEQVEIFYDIIPKVLKEISSTMHSEGMSNESIKECIEKINISLAKTIFGMLKLPSVQEYKKFTFAGKKFSCEFCRIPFSVNNQHKCDDCGMDFMYCTMEGNEI